MCYIWLNGSTLIIWSKIWDQLLFLCFPFDYNHQCDWLLELGVGRSNVLKRDEKRVGGETKTKNSLTSASIWQWFFLIRFFHLELPFPFIKCVTWTLCRQKVNNDNIKININNNNKSNNKTSRATIKSSFSWNLQLWQRLRALPLSEEQKRCQAKYRYDDNYRDKVVS